MIGLIELFFILIVHWIADFICQTDEQAKNKSKSNIALLTHTSIYTVVWIVALFAIYYIYPILDPFTTLKFAIVTFILHTITDYFTSRLNTKLYKEGDIHNFFVSVGFDQVLHYVQLILTYYYLKE